MKRRHLAIGVGIVLLGAVLWLVAVAVLASIRAPGLVAQIAKSEALPVSPHDLPESYVCALLAVQDPTFYRHHGVGLFDGKPGHTTVAQSIGKWLYFDGFSPGVLHLRKIQLMATAVGFDLRIPKEQQLRLFLNRGYFGTIDGVEVHGFADAATTYFKKDLGSLSGPEFLALVARASAPNDYDPIRHPRENEQRVASLQELVSRRCASNCKREDYGAPCAP